MTTKTEPASRSEPPRRAAHHPRHRDGRSVTHTPSDAPRKALLASGLSEYHADLLMKYRRPFPPTPDVYAPVHSARKLWERVGKPHGRFRDWADQAIAPLIPSAEISALSIPSKRGSPTKDYLLSSHIAEIILAKVNNAEGRELIEFMWAASRAFVTIGARNDVRGASLIELTSRIRGRRIAQCIDAGLSTDEAKAAADAFNIRMIVVVTEILTGHAPSHWLDVFGDRIRDVLNTADMTRYTDAFKLIEAIVTVGTTSEEAIVAVLEPTYWLKIDMTKYLEARHLYQEITELKDHVKALRKAKKAKRTLKLVA